MFRFTRIENICSQPKQNGNSKFISIVKKDSRIVLALLYVFFTNTQPTTRMTSARSESNLLRILATGFDFRIRSAIFEELYAHFQIPTKKLIQIESRTLFKPQSYLQTTCYCLTVIAK